MSDDAEYTISFVASLPQILSAVRIHGDGSSRIQLEAPKSELEEVKKLLSCGGLELGIGIVVRRPSEAGAVAQPEADAPRVVGWKERRR